MRNILTSFFLIISSICLGQITVGHYYDMDGMPIHGFIDPLTYSPENQLRLVHQSDSYEKGTVYYQNGQKEDGLIKFENKKIWLKQAGEKKDKLKPEEIVGLTIRIDSFFTATNFLVERKTGASTRTEPEFMQYLTAFDGMTFAKHYNFSSGMAQGYAMASAIIETYQVKKDGDKTWTSFPRRKEAFKKVALPYFEHIPYVKKKILNEELDYTDMMTLIKTAEYHAKYKKGTPLYFDNYWLEVEKEDNWSYEGSISSLEDSIWTIDYYKNAVKLYSAQFSSLYPNRKNGLFTAYYPDGSGRKLAIYEDDQPTAVSTFHPNGVLHYEYEIKSIQIGYVEFNSLHYLQVKNTGGDPIAKPEGIWQESYTDEISERKLINKYNGNEIMSSYREKDNRNIYQLIDPTYDFKLGKLQNKLNMHFDGIEFMETVADNAQGTIFIAVVIDDKGLVDSYEILNSLHPELDEKIKGWAALYLWKSSGYRFKFKPYKIGKEKVFAEFVLPINFSINKFYRRPANYYYDWQFQHFMMQQQMPLNVTPPPMPGRF